MQTKYPDIEVVASFEDEWMTLVIWRMCTSFCETSYVPVCSAYVIAAVRHLVWHITRQTEPPT